MCFGQNLGNLPILWDGHQSMRRDSQYPQGFHYRMDDHGPSIPCSDHGTHVHRCTLIQWKHLCAVDGDHAQLPCGVLWQLWIDRMVKCSTFAFQRFVASAIMGEMSTMRPLNRQSPKAKAGGASGASGHGRMNLAFPLRALVERINVNDDPAWAACMSPDIIRAERAERSARETNAREIPREIPSARAELPRLLGARSSILEVPAEHQTSGGCCGHLQLTGRVWELSQDAKGCRDVQRAIEEAADNVTRSRLVAELAGHVLDAMRCPHANHVLQKCITCSRPQDCQFIVDEIMACHGFAELAARHKFGCRIIQRLVEQCPQQVEGMASAILSDVSSIARHPYGNYVLQNLLEHGSPSQRRRLAEELILNVAPICQDSFGSAVVASALTKLSQEDTMSLAKAIVQEDGLLTFMAHARHGHAAVRLILQALDGPNRAKARDLLCAELPSLKVSRYGRVVAGWIEAEGRKCHPAMAVCALLTNLSWNVNECSHQGRLRLQGGPNTSPMQVGFCNNKIFINSRTSQIADDDLPHGEQQNRGRSVADVSRFKVLNSADCSLRKCVDF
eukprot:s456_g9.t1